MPDRHVLHPPQLCCNIFNTKYSKFQFIGIFDFFICHYNQNLLPIFIPFIQYQIYTYNPAILTNSNMLWTTSPVFKIFISNLSSPNSIICLRLIVKSLLSATFNVHFAQLSPHHLFVPAIWSRYASSMFIILL